MIPPMHRTGKQGFGIYSSASRSMSRSSGVGQASAGNPRRFCSARIAARVFMPILPSAPPVSWPRPVGGNTAAPLSTYDYPNFVQSAQPAYPAVPAGA